MIKDIIGFSLVVSNQKHAIDLRLNSPVNGTCLYVSRMAESVKHYKQSRVYLETSQRLQFILIRPYLFFFHLL